MPETPDPKRSFEDAALTLALRTICSPGVVVMTDDAAHAVLRLHERLAAVEHEGHQRGYRQALLVAVLMAEEHGATVTAACIKAHHDDLAALRSTP